LEETDMQPYQRKQKLTGSHEIHRRYTSTRPPPVTSPERGQRRDGSILTSRCWRRLTILKKIFKLLKEGRKPHRRGGTVRRTSKATSTVKGWTN
jgi:hypothetical protein